MVAKISPAHDMLRTLGMIQFAGFRDAIIAGGAIRDHYHNVMHTDVDIFIQPYVTDQIRPRMPNRPFNHAEWEDFWVKTMQLKPTKTLIGDRVRWHYSAYSEPDDEVLSEDRDVMAVWNVVKNLEHYQIIFTRCSPIEYVDVKFDFGLCKAYCDGTKMHFTRDFVRDSRRKTISLVGQGLSTSQVSYALKQHLPRIQEKYPGYQLVVPGQN